jgi:uncharacterized membrane protein required for colicin V production
MNNTLIIVGAIFLVCMIIGYIRGFIRIVASLAATLAIIVLVTFLSPYVSGVLMNVLPVEEMVEEKAMEILLGEKQAVDEAEENEEGEMEIVIPEEVETSREVQISLIENSKMPEMFRRLLLENNNNEIYQVLGVSSFSDYVVKYLAKLFTDIASFLITLLAVTIIVRTLIYILGIISDLPLVGGINRLAGAVLGLGTGLIVVWLFFIVITFVYDNKISQMCMQDIAANEILMELYNKNVLMNFITKFKA